MALIRADRVSIEPLRFSLRDFGDEAEQIIESAAIDAQAILAEARRQAENIVSDARQQARAQGWREGYEQGQALGRQEALDTHGEALDLAAQSLTQLCSEVDETCARLEMQAESNLVRLAIAIADRLVHRVGMIDSEVLRSNVAQAIKLAARSQSVRIAVHPRQREIIDAIWPRIEAELRSPQRCELVEDESISPGGCRILTQDGQIDATLETQLAHLAELLLPASIHGQTGSLFAS